MGQLQTVGHGAQSLVIRPQRRAGRQTGCGQEMHVDITNAAAEKRVAIDESQNFSIARDGSLRQVGQGVQDDPTLPQRTQGNLPAHKRMT